MSRDDAPRLVDVTKELPEPMASVIRLVYGDHLSLAETAARLDLTVREVSSTVNEALDRIYAPHLPAHADRAGSNQ